MNLSMGRVSSVQEPSNQLATGPLNGARLSSGPDGRDGVYCWEQTVAMDTAGEVASGPH